MISLFLFIIYQLPILWGNFSTILAFRFWSGFIGSPGASWFTFPFSLRISLADGS